MKRFLKRFRICLIILLVLAAFYFILTGIHSLTGSLRNGERQNVECATKERVFDQTDVLTEEEEEKLRKLIAKRERQTGCDIVLVTLNESLRDYARERQEYVPAEKYVMLYADDFYDEYLFGYDKPGGNGVLFLDNLYREDDGYAYSWLCTTGKAEGKLNGAMIDHLLEKSYRWSRLGPYHGYKAYINQFYHDMNGFGLISINISVPVLLAVSFILAVLFVVINTGSEAGGETVPARTYVKGGKVNIHHREDRFMRKSVVQHKIQTGSGGEGGHSGGGGHHVSGSGASHGGGGHRH